MNLLQFDWILLVAYVCQDAPRVFQDVRMAWALDAEDMPHRPDPTAAMSCDPHEVNPWASMCAPGSCVDCAVHAFVCSCHVIARCTRRARLGDSH